MGRLLVRTEDKVAVPVRVYEGADQPWAVVLVNPAMGVPQHHYAPLAHWLVQWGVRVVTFDYRGVGEARPRSLRGFSADLRDWAEDARAVVRFASRAAGHRPVVVLGHGFGGQLLGLVDELAWAAGLVLVGATLPHWTDWKGSAGARLLWQCHLTPSLTRLFGYLPAWSGLGVELPGGVARDWCRCLRHPQSLLGYDSQAAERFRRFPCPVLSFSFADDEGAPETAVSRLVGALGTRRLQRKRIDTASRGRPAVDHLAFFRPEVAEGLWPEVLAFVRRVSIREARLRSSWSLPSVADGRRSPSSSSGRRRAAQR
jgi:predicted alpha/beta hydrolase